MLGAFWGIPTGARGLFHPSGAGWVGCELREHSLVWNQETGEEEVIQGGVVARSPVQNLAGARFIISPEPGS